MVIIRFPDPQTEKRAIGFLLGRFSFKTWANGETLVPTAALARLAREGIRYSVESYEKLIPAFRNPAASSV